MELKIQAAIIGVQKAGTTALKELIGQHPAIQTHLSQEFPYFLQSEYSPEHVTQKLIDFGVDDMSKKITLIKSVGVFGHTDALNRLYQHNPDTKIIIVLREPIERAYSSFWYAKFVGMEPLQEFGAAIRERNRYPDDEQKFRNLNYVDYGFYVTHLKKVEEFFPEKNILLINYSDLKKSPNQVANNVFAFLGCESIEVENKIANETKVAKKSNWNRLLRMKNNPFIRVLKKLLPLQNRLAIRKKIKQLSGTKEKIPAMQEADKQYLQQIYLQPNQELDSKYGIRF